MWLYIGKGYGSQDIYKWCLKLEKKPLIIKIKRLEHYWQIYLKCLFPGVMFYWFLTFMQMVSTYSPVPYCREIKIYLWTNFPTHFTLSFSTFTRFWLEKSLLFFEGLRQISKTHPCYFFPLIVRHGKVAFEHVTSP